MSFTPSDAYENDMPSSDQSLPSEFWENLPEDLRDHLAHFLGQSSGVESFTGILPPPSLLAQYEPDVQRIIFEAAVENRKHRTALEARGQQIEFYRKVFGLLFGFALALVIIVGSLYIILSGHRAEGLIGIGATMLAAAAAFVYTDRQRQTESAVEQELSASFDRTEHSASTGTQTPKAEEGHNV